MIKPEEIPTLYQKLKSHIARDFRPSAVTQTIIGGGGATSFSALTGTIANAQAPQFLLRDGTRSLTGSLSVDSGVTIDGVDISAHAADPNAHHAQQHSITGGDHTISGAALSLVGATATNTLGLITPSSNPGTAESVLKSVSGLLTLPNFTATTGVRTPLIDTASGGLTIAPANATTAITGSAVISVSVQTPLITTATNVDLLIDPGGTGAVRFPNAQTLRTSTFDGWAIPYTTGFQINEFAPVPGGSASVLTIGRIQADELNVRVFVANETRVDRGDEFWTKSFGIVALGFTTPASIGGTVSVKFENSPALAGAIFANNDWLLIRKLEIDSGLSLFNVWGQVATYVNNGDGTQNWTFTLRGGPTSKLIEKGSLGIDFGQAGAGLIHLSVVDASGSPYIKLRKWVSGSDPMTINGPNFTTYVQLGHLGSTGNAYVTPAGFGLYARSTSDDSRFILADDNGLQIRGASFKMYNSTLQTVDISATNGSIKLGTDISSAATTSFDFNGATGDLAITGDLYTGKVYLLRASGLNTEQDVWGSWDNRRALQWWPNLTNMTGDPSLSMYTGKHSGGSFPNQNWAYIDSNPTGGVLASLSVTAHGQGTGTDATIYLEGGSQSLASTPAVTIIATDIDLVAAVAVTGSLSVGGTAVSLDGHTHSYLPLSGGTLTGALTSRAITPNADNTHDLGASGARWQDVYAVNLHVGTIVGTPSYSHSHAASDITSGTLDFARIPTTWTGALTLDADSAGTSNYVRWLTQTSTGKAWDLIGRAHDFATAAQQNDMLLTYYDGTTTHIVFQADNATRIVDFGQTPTVGGTAVSLSGHAHDDRYFTETESDARYVQTATLNGYLLADGTRAGATSQAQAFNLGVIAIAPDATTSQLTLRSARAALVSTNVIGGVNFQSNDTSLTAPGTVTASIQALAGTTHTASQLRTDLVFSTTEGTTTTERMRIVGNGPVTIPLDMTVGWIKNSMIGFGGEGASDSSMLGALFDRSELTNADLRGTVTITITGAGSVSTDTINNAFNARGGYMTITGTDNTTTQIVIHIDLLAAQSNYGSANWHPFLKYRLSMNSVSTHYRTIVCEVSADNSTWYKPSGGLWETTSAQDGEIVPGLWMGASGNPSLPSNVYRYVRFTLTNRFEDAAYASKALVWISQIGLRHHAAPASRAWAHTSGDTMYGALVVKTTNTAALDIENASGTSIFTVNTTTPSATVAGIIYAGSDIEMTGELLAANGSASVPSVAALSDTNTGLYWSAADTLAVTTDGVLRASFNSSGVTVASAVTVPTINTASGNLTLTPDGGTVAVSAALTVGTTATITGVTSIASGSVGAPGLTFTGDTNSGLYRSGGDAYSLVAGGAAIINVGATGAGVNAAYDNTAALKVQSVANDDITLFLKQKSGQTARMWRVEDSAGQELIVLDSQGNLQSGNPGFYPGLKGWQIAPIGNAEFNNITARGELHASIFVMDEFHASGGTLYIAPAGKLELDATVYTTTGIEAVFDIRTTSVSGSGSQFDIRTTSGSGSGSQFTWRTIENYFEITDPPSGHAMILSPGDIIRCKALGLSVGIDLWDVWGVVGRVEDMTDYYRYYYERKSGGADGLVIPAGTAIISYGAPGDGRIYLTADQNYAPYMQVFLSGEEPWNGQITPTVRIGRLDGVGLPGVSGIEQHGIVLSSDLSDASAPYLVASNLQMFQYKIDSEWNNGNPTARITADGEFRLGTDVDSDATTGLKFNPITGALDIGNASYPGTVNVRGIITVTGGSGIAAFTDANLDNIANGATFGRINNTIIGGGFIRVGSGDKDSTLNGWYVDAGEIVGQAAGVDQVVLDAGGKIMAGAGALQLDRTAFHVANSVTSKGIQFYNTATFTNGNKAGRLWALNGTPYIMNMSAGRSTFDGDSTNAAGQIQLVGLGASGIAGASVEISGSTQIVEITASEIDAFGDLDMNGYDIIDANNCWAMRSTAAL